MPKELAKQYAPQGTEDRIYQNWCNKGYFHTQIDRSKKPFTIVMPPPNLLLYFFHVFKQCKNRPGRTAKSFAKVSCRQC